MEPLLNCFLSNCRLWDIEIGACLRVLEGHEQLVRCIRFDSKRIVSGAYDGYVQIFVIIVLQLIESILHYFFFDFDYDCFRRIKVWDLQAAMNPRSPPDNICLLTLVVSVI